MDTLPMRIYVSSTFVDLRDYREKVIEAINRLQHQAVAMESYGAEDQTPVEKCVADVATCDLYVGLFAHRYGFVPAGYDQSITELEYRAALKHGVPTLVFLLDEDAAWESQYRDKGEARTRIETLREELQKAKVVRAFRDLADLAVKASTSIAAKIHEIQAKSIEAPTKTTRPRLEVHLARLPMTGKNCFGREAELDRLDEAWREGRTNIFEVVALGGAGKSALVNRWLAAMARQDYRGAERVFAWNFYEGESIGVEAAADLFVATALGWFGDPEPGRGAPWERGLRLAGLVRKHRTLLLLDGLESLQFPRGPDEGKLRDQALQALLRELAGQNPGMCVVTTRARIRDLDAYVGQTVEEIILEPLPESAAVDLLTDLGVRGQRDELMATVRDFRGHALSLTLLARALTDSFDDGDVANRHEIGLEAAAFMESYERWLGEGPELDLLRVIGAFNRPASATAINAILKAPIISGLTEHLPRSTRHLDWNKALSRLRRLKLVAEKNEQRPDLIDTHPLVRQHFSQWLRTQNEPAWREANSRLFDHYQQLVTVKLPETLEEMAHLFHAVGHGCHAGRYQETWDSVYWPRVRNEEDGYSVLTLGAWGADLMALTGFFDEPWERPTSALTDLAQARLLTETAFDLRGLGRLEEAAGPFRAGLNRHRAAERWWSAADAAGNLSELLVLLGELRQAARDAEQSIVLAEQAADRNLIVTNRATLAEVLLQLGKPEQAEEEFRLAEALYREANPTVTFLHALRGYHYCDLLLSLGRHDEVLARAEAGVKIDAERKRPYGVALARLTIARTFAAIAKTNGQGFHAADAAMRQAMKELIDVGHQEMIVRGLLASAELRRWQADLSQAEVELREVAARATRAQMRLFLVDATIQSAFVDLDRGRLPSARSNLATARRAIQTMGYDRRLPDLATLMAAIDAA